MAGRSRAGFVVAAAPVAGLLLLASIAGAQTPEGIVLPEASLLTPGAYQDPEPARAPIQAKPYVFRMLGRTQIVLAGIDGCQTAWALGSGHYVEANALMRIPAEHPWTLGPAKAYGAIAFTAISDRLWDTGHRKTAWIVRIAAVATQAVIVGINQHTLSKGR